MPLYKSAGLSGENGGISTRFYDMDAMIVPNTLANGPKVSAFEVSVYQEDVFIAV